MEVIGDMVFGETREGFVFRTAIKVGDSSRRA